MLNTVFTTEIIIPSYRRMPILLHAIERIRVLYPDIPICLGLQEEVQDDAYRKQIATDRNIRVVQMPAPSTTLTLNRCIETSNADIVLILDDDAVPFFGCLEAHLKAYSDDPALAYTSGREVRSSKERSAFSELFRIILEACVGLLLERDTKLNGRIVGWTTRLGFIFGNFDQPGVCRINSPRGCNMAVRREPFTEIGGFNESFRGNAWGFEADFGLRMAKRNKYGQYRGDAIVIHHEVSSGGSRAAQKHRWFSDFLFNHKLLIQHLGPQAWFGSVPRLLNKRFFSQG